MLALLVTNLTLVAIDLTMYGKSLNIPVLRELKDMRGMLHGASSWSQGLSPYLHLWLHVWSDL